MSKFIMEDVNAIYTATISEYLNKGYIVNMMTMGGSQSSEICHVDLINPSDKKYVIRVWMLWEFDRRLHNYDCFGDAVKLSVKRYENNNNTFWSSTGEELHSKVFYSIDKSHKCFVDTFEEYTNIAELKSQRFSNRLAKEDFKRCCCEIDLGKLSKSVKDAIVAKIREEKGMKRAKFDVVTRVYTFHNHGRLYCHVKWERDDKFGVIILK